MNFFNVLSQSLLKQTWCGNREVISYHNDSWQSHSGIWWDCHKKYHVGSVWLVVLGKEGSRQTSRWLTTLLHWGGSTDDPSLVVILYFLIGRSSNYLAIWRAGFGLFCLLFEFTPFTVADIIAVHICRTRLCLLIWANFFSTWKKFVSECWRHSMSGANDHMMQCHP